MRNVNRSKFFLLLAVWTALSVPFTYFVFRQNEASIARSAQRFLRESPAQEGAVENAQIFYRFFCSTARHRFCSVKVINSNGQILASVPTLVFEEPLVYSQSIRLPLNQFQPPLLVVLTFVPSSVSILVWAGMALGIAALAGVVAWSFGLRTAKLTLERNLRLELELRKVEEGFGNLAAQVAHDIRSPLAALDNVVGNLKFMPEDDRILVRTAVNRIKDIANNLIEKNRELRVGISAQLITKTLSPFTKSAATSEPSMVQLLSSLIDPLITEKRMQFRTKIGIEIDGRLGGPSYGLFSKIQPTEFKRLLSNLVNNAVEVLGDQGMVIITLGANGNQIELRVLDNGKGISPEILARLGQRGETYGKLGGSGLGLHHARTTVESWGGTLEIASEIGKGTSVNILLPRSMAPDWFVSELKLEPEASVVILDDDSSIHGIWQGRFESLRADEKKIQILHFSTPDELTKWVTESPSVRTRAALYLLDFELLGFKQTGLDLIENLKLGSQSILVTSRFEEKQIRENCQRLNVRLIPKGMAGFVPISFVEPLQRPDYVILDDDDLVHMTWQNAAKSNEKTILHFRKPEEIFDCAFRLSRTTSIYVDSQLGNGVKGEDVAKKLSDLGFSEVWLCTGLPSENFKNLPYLRGCVGKIPPWLL